jgi:hypothetical protein
MGGGVFEEMTGRISIYDKGGSLIDSRTYPSLVIRKCIIDKWKQRYGPLYENLYLQFAPEVNSEHVHPDGSNKYSKRNQHEKGKTTIG